MEGLLPDARTWKSSEGPVKRLLPWLWASESQWVASESGELLAEGIICDA